MEQYHEQRQTRATPLRQTTQRTNRDVYEDDLYDDSWSPRMPTSTRRYRSDVQYEMGRTSTDIQAYSPRERITQPERKTVQPQRRTADVPVVPASRRRPTNTVDVTAQRPAPTKARPQDKGRPHWLVYVGIATFVMVIGWILTNSFMSWWQVTQDDLHYGRPRTYQTDVAVGHNDSLSHPSHFIALNLSGHIEIIEFPGGDATKAKIYIGPVLIGSDKDLAPVTLTFTDVNGDGKPDMIINVQGGHIVFINDNGQFRPAHPGEKILL